MVEQSKRFIKMIELRSSTAVPAFTKGSIMNKIRAFGFAFAAVAAIIAACSDSNSPTGPGQQPISTDYTWRVHATTSYFAHISGRAADDIYAMTRGNVIFHFDGDSWRNTMSFPDLACYSDYYPLWATTDGELFIGCGNTVYRYDGAKWLDFQLSPDIIVAGLWGTASDDMFAVGSDHTGNAVSAVFHCDGNEWLRVPHDVTKPLTAVGGTPTGHVFAVGEEGALLHFDGDTWSTLSAPTTRDFRALWAASESLVVAVGDMGTIIHYDGAAFEVFVSGTSWEINAVWGNGPDDIYAGGGVHTMFHYDGDSWSPMADPDSDVKALWTTPEGVLFAATMYGGIRRYEDPSWTTEFTMPQESLYEIWGVDHNDVYAAGVQHVFHYDGTGWSEAATRPSGGAAYCEGIGGTSPTDVWVVWSNAKIQHFDGASWAEVPHSTGASWLSDVWAAASGDVYAVGGQDKVIHWDGMAWSTLNAVTGLYPRAVDGTGCDCVFIVGLGGDIRLLRRGRWIQMKTPSEEHLIDISVVDKNTAYAAIQGGGMLVYDGIRWTRIDTPAYFSSIWAPVKNEVFGLHYRVGDIYHWNGHTWKLYPRVSHYQYDGKIWGHSRDAFWVAGSMEHPGIIIEYQLVK
jgi:hypothetical protein